MAYSRKYKGKYVDVNPDNPDAVAICQRSGFIFNHKDLVKQMRWSGNTQVWDEIMVGRPFLDALNEQNRPPMIKPDPIPIKDARPPIPNPPNNNIALPYKELEILLNDYKWNSNE
jgi:hypothetical protein